MGKKYIVGFILGSLLVGFAAPEFFVSAASLSAEALKLQVDSLILQVENLQSELNAVRNTGAPVQVPAPVSNLVQPAPVIGNKFSNGDRIQAVDHLNVRATPGGSSLIVVSPGTRGTIVGGPTVFGGYTWWSVSYDIKTTGWSVEDWMTKADEFFSPEGDNAPVFSETSFVSPTSVGVGDSNWWRIQATDQKGGAINYVIDWGDGKSDSYTLKSGADIAAYHIYSQPGSFRITARATNSVGATATRNLVVKVLSEDQLGASNKFSIGDYVKTTDSLNVRTGPSGVWKAIAALGTKGQIIGGPVWSIIGRWWWSINYDNGVSGWSAEDWLEKTSTPVDYSCGDLDKNGAVDIVDVLLMRSYWVGGVAIPTGVNADMNGDGVAANIIDYTLLDNYALKGGPAPTCQPNPVAGGPAACGDIDENGLVDYNDVEELSQYVFGGKTITDMNLVDLNRDGAPNVVDLTLLINHVNRGGPAPTCQPATPSVSPEPEQPVYVCGDVDGDGDIDFSDVDTLSDYVFGGSDVPKGKVDLNYDGAPDIVDVVTLQNYLRGKSVIPTCGKAARSYQCGDLNLDGTINKLDIDYLTNYAFYSGTLPSGVSPDFNGDGVGNVADVARLIDHVNRGGPPPSCTFGSGGGGGDNQKGPSLSASVFDTFLNFLKSL